MCKLFGWVANNQANNNEQALKNISKILKGLILSEVHNNPHGLGLYAVTTDQKEFFKKWKNGYQMFLEPYNLDAILPKVKFIMGHLRYATTGVVSKEMSHPYKFSHIVGAHNGVLRIKPEREGESDSKAFFRKLNRRIKKGMTVHNALQELLGKREIGDYAFTIWNRKEKKMYFIRHRRPLTFFRTPLGLFWASTKEMWEIALEIGEITIPTEQQIVIKEDVLYTLNGMELEEVCKIKPPRRELVYSSRYYIGNRKFKGNRDWYFYSDRDWYLYSENDYWPEDDYWSEYNYWPKDDWWTWDENWTEKDEQAVKKVLEKNKEM